MTAQQKQYSMENWLLCQKSLNLGTTFLFFVFFSPNSRRSTVEFKIIFVFMQNWLHRTLSYMKQNLKADQILQAGTPARHSSHHFTASPAQSLLAAMCDHASQS